MRDVGILVWVGLLIVGVVGSMISSLRKGTRAQLQQQPLPPGQPGPSAVLRRVLPQLPQSAAPAPKPRPAVGAPSVPPRPVVEHPLPHPGLTARQRLFGERRSLVRAVIAAEVLGKPRALSDEYFRS